ncbi:hypothetical protein [Actinomadura sp. NPDC049753]|uniref:hypothetical protein n=1 Tax=Actinomadura sp. NPDC049753 TaxID=3154739 RepID=UPI0034219CAA
MSASKRTRRRLFERGGGRCAMCQRSLVIDPGPDGTEYHIAEAAHIVAEKPDGPRGAVDRPGDIDGLANLVLLCPSDHSTIDKGDGPRLWPRAKLLRLKRDHESWMAVLAGRTEPRPFQQWRILTPPRPGDIVVVDGEPYRLCGETTSAKAADDCTDGAFETMTCDGGIWLQGHAFGEGTIAGHVWLRRSEAAPGLRAALVDEAALLMDLPPIPGLPPLSGVDMTPETVTLVTAMVSPTSILDRLAGARKVLGHDELLLLSRALPSLADALAELHGRGFAHRALSPGAILMPDARTLALRDLGLATVPPRAGERDDPYHAPEQAAGSAPPGPPADVHRLARILYELVTGRPAGRGARQVAPSVLNPAVPAACDAVFAAALTPDPARRPGVRAFAEGLRVACIAPFGA